MLGLPRAEPGIRGEIGTRELKGGGREISRKGGKNQRELREG